MKSLIVYYSFSHNNELLAKSLQQRLGCGILKIETVKKRSAFAIFMDIMFNREPAILSYARLDLNIEHFVFVAPIWAGRIASPLRTFLKTEKNSIKHYSFISLCGGAKGQKEKIEKELTRLLSTDPHAVMELWVSNLLNPEREKSVTRHRVTDAELERYKTEIDYFVNQCNSFTDAEQKNAGHNKSEEYRRAV
jgi:flavodoxin